MMTKTVFNQLLLGISLLSYSSCSNAGSGTSAGNKDTTAVVPSMHIKNENVSYTADSLTMNSYIAYDASKHGKLPVVLVIPEWWGINDYPKMRARQLAELGYFAMAVDMYGNGKVPANPDEAQQYASPFYADPQLGKSRIEAALSKAKTFMQADTSKLAVIGYCFGGAMALNSAKMGTPFNAVVSFHGSLAGVPPKKDKVKAKFLICHGGADQFVSEKDVQTFKKQMDDAGVSYNFKVYPNATHAFTNPEATEVGKKFNMPVRYNGAADTASWNDMKAFLSSVL